MTLKIGFFHRVWGTIAVDLVRTLVVVKLYVCPDMFSEFSLGTVVIAIELFCFESFEKCLHHGVIVWRAFPRE